MTRRETRGSDGGKGKFFFYMTVVVIIVLVVATLLFNRNGFMALSALRSDIDSVSLSIENLELQIDSLETEIERLLSDSSYMEQMVRTVLGWGRDGEYIIRYSPPSDLPDSTLQ